MIIDWNTIYNNSNDYAGGFSDNIRSNIILGGASPSAIVFASVNTKEFFDITISWIATPRTI